MTQVSNKDEHTWIVTHHCTPTPQSRTDIIENTQDNTEEKV